MRTRQDRRTTGNLREDTHEQGVGQRQQDGAYGYLHDNRLSGCPVRESVPALDEPIHNHPGYWPAGRRCHIPAFLESCHATVVPACPQAHHRPSVACEEKRASGRRRCLPQARRRGLDTTNKLIQIRFSPDFGEDRGTVWQLARRRVDDAGRGSGLQLPLRDCRPSKPPVRQYAAGAAAIARSWGGWQATGRPGRVNGKSRRRLCSVVRSRDLNGRRGGRSRLVSPGAWHEAFRESPGFGIRKDILEMTGLYVVLPALPVLRVE